MAPGPADLAVPVATQWHCAHTVASEAQVPGATEAVEKNTTTSVCLVLKVFITVHFGSTSMFNLIAGPRASLTLDHGSWILMIMRFNLQEALSALPTR